MLSQYLGSMVTDEDSAIQAKSPYHRLNLHC